MVNEAFRSGEMEMDTARTVSWSLAELGALNDKKNEYVEEVEAATTKSVKKLEKDPADKEKMGSLLQMKKDTIIEFGKHFEASMTIYDKANLLGMDMDSIEDGDVAKRLMEHFGINEENRILGLVKTNGWTLSSMLGVGTKKFDSEIPDGVDKSLLDLLNQFKNGVAGCPGYIGNASGLLHYDDKINNLAKIKGYRSGQGKTDDGDKVEKIDAAESREKEQLIDDLDFYINKLKLSKNVDPIFTQTINSLIKEIENKKNDKNINIRKYISELKKDGSEYNTLLKNIKNIKTTKNKNENQETVGNSENSLKLIKFIRDNMIGWKYYWGGGRTNKEVDIQKKQGVDCSGMIIYAMRKFGIPPPGGTATDMFNNTEKTSINKKGYSTNTSLLKDKEKIKPGQIIFWKGHGGKFPETYRGNGVHHVALVGNPAIIDGKLNIIEATPPKLKEGTIDIESIHSSPRHKSTIHIHDMNYG